MNITTNRRSNIILESNPDFIIFFDDQHVQRFTINFSVNLAANGTPATANITMCYLESLLNIEYLTDVKIFIKNVFSNRYRMVFDGQIHARQIASNSQGKYITFTAYDNLYWLQKVSVPVLFGIDQEISELQAFSWMSRGINFDKVKNILTVGVQAFSNMNLTQTIAELFRHVDTAMAIHAGQTDVDRDTIYHWINLANKIKVVSDVEATLRDYNPIDVLSTGAIIENMYSFLNNIVNNIGYELFQDIDGLIKIKEPFWDEAILKDHVIDPIIVTDFVESTQWDNQFTRVLVQGGAESAFTNTARDQFSVDIITPAGVYVGDQDYFVTTDQTYLSGVPPATQFYVKKPVNITEEASRENIVNLAHSAVGRPYKLYEESPFESGTDCSGLVYWAYKNAGYGLSRLKAHGFYGIATPISVGQLQPGDLGFSFERTYTSDKYRYGEANHVGIYGGVVNGKHVWYEALPKESPVQGAGCVMRRVWDSPHGASWQAFGNLIDAIEHGFSGSQVIPVPTGTDQHKLTVLSERERKYGINVYETQQPYIRIGIFYGSDDPYRQTAYTQLERYTKYLYKALNAASDMATLTCIGAPWLRPGTNVWFDPEGISRVFYVTSVQHTGGPGGINTSLGLVYGRSEQEYQANYKERGIANSFTAVNHISPSQYYQADPASKYPLITGGPSSNMDAFKTYMKDTVHAAHAGKGSVNAYESEYRNWYGAELIRKNTAFLNRWDSEFNLFELYCIISAQYKTVSTSVLNSYLKAAPTSGPTNPIADGDRSISSLARAAVEADLNIYTPTIIITRSQKLRTIISNADKEINNRYPMLNSRYQQLKGL